MITCPFCNEGDFDLVGLKLHIANNFCEEYNNLDVSLLYHKHIESNDATWDELGSGFVEIEPSYYE